MVDVRHRYRGRKRILRSCTTKVCIGFSSGLTNSNPIGYHDRVREKLFNRHVVFLRLESAEVFPSANAKVWLNELQIGIEVGHRSGDLLFYIKRFIALNAGLQLNGKSIDKPVT